MKLTPKQLHGSTTCVDYIQPAVPTTPSAGQSAVVQGTAPGGLWPSPEFDNSVVEYDGSSWQKLYTIVSGQRFSLRSRFLQAENEQIVGFDGSSWIQSPDYYGTAFPTTQLWPGRRFFRSDLDGGAGIGYCLSSDLSTWVPMEYSEAGGTLPTTTWDGRRFFYTATINQGPENGTDRGLWATYDDVRGKWLGDEEQVEFAEPGQLIAFEYFRYGNMRTNATRGPKIPFDAVLTGFAWRSQDDCQGDITIRRLGVILHTVSNPGRDLAANNLNININAGSVMAVRAGNLTTIGRNVSCILKFRRRF